MTRRDSSRKCARLIQRAVVACAHETAVALEGGKLIGQRRRKSGGKVRNRGGAAALPPAPARRGCSPACFQLGRAPRAPPEMPSRIAARSRGPPRPTTSRASARKRSGAAFRRLRRISPAPVASVNEKLHRVVAPGDGLRIGERCGQPLGHEGGAGGGQAAIDCSEQRSAALSGSVRTSSRLAARGRIDQRATRLRARAPAARAADARRARALDIADARRRRGRLEPRQRPEAVRRGEGRNRPARRRSAVEPSNTSRASGATAGSERK